MDERRCRSGAVCPSKQTVARRATLTINRFVSHFQPFSTPTVMVVAGLKSQAIWGVTIRWAGSALDGPGHGGNALLVHPESAAVFQAGIQFFQKYKATPLIGMLTRGRDRDLNNDGIPDPGGDMWTSDLFHTRDMVRQAAIEYMQFVRILRAFGQDGNLGDLTGDGKTDIGGRDSTIGMWGISLGGVVSGVMAGAEPGLDSASPNAGGAGLADIAIRASQAGVPEAVLLPIVGPLIAGCLPVDDNQVPLEGDAVTDQDCLRVGTGEISGDTMTFAFLANDVARLKRVKIGQLRQCMWVTASNIRISTMVKLCPVGSMNVVLFEWAFPLML